MPVRGKAFEGASSWRRRHGETLATVTSTRTRTDPAVRSLAWKILLANHRPSLGLERWASLVEEAGGPEDVKRLTLDEPVPLAPFVEVLEAIGAEIAQDPQEGLQRVGRSFVDRWASMYRTLVDHLEGRPERMVEVAAEEVLPWFFEDAGPSIASLGPGHARISLSQELPHGFQIGLIEGFLAQTGASVELETDEDRLDVSWRVDEPPRPNPLQVLAEATRARLLTATIVPVLVGTALALGEGGLAWVRGAAALAAAASLHLSANLLNDVFDHRRGVDEANLTPTPFSGGSRVIQRGLLGSRRVLSLAVGLAGVGSGLGLWLAATTGPELFVLGALGVVIGYAYSGDPFRLSHRGLGELAAGLVFGPGIAAGAYAVQTGHVSAEALLVGIPVGALMAALLAVNELPDARWDARTGKDTLVVRVGQKAPLAIAAMLGLAYASLVGLLALGVADWPLLAGLATVPLAVHVVQGVDEAGFDAEELVPYLAAMYWLHATTGLLVVLGLAAGGLS